VKLEPVAGLLLSLLSEAEVGHLLIAPAGRRLLREHLSDADVHGRRHRRPYSTRATTHFLHTSCTVPHAGHRGNRNHAVRVG